MKLETKEDIINFIHDEESKLQQQFKQIDLLCEINSMKVLNAFQKNHLSEVHFNSTTGYGYSDIGRDTIEKIYADIFNCEDALVRSQFISGSHALTVCLFALLRPNDTLLSITGLPYDTLHEVIGIKENNSSLKSFGINYEQIDLVDNDIVVDCCNRKLQIGTDCFVSFNHEKIEFTGGQIRMVTFFFHGNSFLSLTVDL